MECMKLVKCYDGLFYGHPWQVMIQLFAALTIIVWDATVTFLLLKLIGLVIPLRMPDDILEIGDLAIHSEQLEPSETARRLVTYAEYADDREPTQTKIDPGVKRVPLE